MKKWLLSLIFLLILPFISATKAEAKVAIEKNGPYTLGAGEVVNDDLFVGADTADIAGTVLGNLYVGAGSVSVTGTVKGDVFVGAGSVNIAGAHLAGSVHLGAGQVTIDKNTTIGGSLLAGAGTFDDEAAVGRNLFVGAGNLTINGRVGKEARLAGGKIALGPATVVAGDLTYVMGNDASIAESPTATIAGTVTKMERPAVAADKGKAIATELVKYKDTVGHTLALIGYLSALLMGLLMLKLFPKPSRVVADATRHNILRNLGIGFLACLVIVPGFFILLFTVLAAPLALLSVALFLTCFYLAKLVVGYALGFWAVEKLGWKKQSAYLVFAIGFTLFTVIRMVPVGGGLVNVLAVLVGLGALLTSATRLIGK